MSASNSAQIRRTRRWPIVLGVIAVLLVGVYFVATSSAIIKSIVLPRVAAAVGSDVTAEDISLSPFSSIVIRGLKVVPKGESALAEVKEIRARYSLVSILRGNIVVDEVTVDGPTINVVEKADGSGNLASLLKSLPKSEGQKQASPVPQLSIKNVSLKD